MSEEYVEIISAPPITYAVRMTDLSRLGSMEMCMTGSAYQHRLWVYTERGPFCEDIKAMVPVMYLQNNRSTRPFHDVINERAEQVFFRKARRAPVKRAEPNDCAHCGTPLIACPFYREYAAPLPDQMCAKCFVANPPPQGDARWDKIPIPIIRSWLVDVLAWAYYARNHGVNVLSILTTLFCLLPWLRPTPIWMLACPLSASWVFTQICDVEPVMTTDEISTAVLVVRAMARDSGVTLAAFMLCFCCFCSYVVHEWQWYSSGTWMLMAVVAVVSLHLGRAHTGKWNQRHVLPRDAPVAEMIRAETKPVLLRRFVERHNIVT